VSGGGCRVRGMKSKDAPTLTPLLQAFVDAHNAFDGSALAACFCGDGKVFDEGQEYAGTEAIAAWFSTVSAKYRARLEVRSQEIKGDKAVIAGPVSGQFEGSPIWLRYRMSLRGGKIAQLKIAP
jgi:ketosteroid isomerase-like protein